MREKILEMEEYANEHNVPIIEKDSIAFIMKFIKANNVKSVLEIGTAIGYSAILMAQATDDVVVTTDDSEIALLAEKFGASVIRYTNLVEEEPVSLDALVHNAMIQKEKLTFDEYDIVITIKPTSPLLRAQTLDKTIEKFGQDYRYQDKLNPIKELQNRKKDNYCIARNNKKTC